MNQLRLPRNLYEQIMTTIGVVPTESGGIFSVNENTVSDYYFDVDAGTGKRCYQPTALRVEENVNRWLQEGKSFGYIHSHRPGLTQLSPMDLHCAQVNIRCNHLPFLYMGLVVDGKLYFYRVFPACDGEGKVETCTFEITEEENPIPEQFHMPIPKWFSDMIQEKINAFEKEK